MIATLGFGREGGDVSPKRPRAFEPAIPTFIVTLLATVAVAQERPFPAVIPEEKPDHPMSAAMERLYDQWNPHEDRANELYSNFKYTELEGFKREANVSRRDPTKVVKVDGIYHVWYTGRRSECPPVGLQNATATKPGTDWDLADIWHATSKDGWNWVEDKQPAVRRPPKPEWGFRSICTPGILVAAKDLLERNPDPSETEIRFWLAGNLCRCTGYDKIIRAVQDAAAEMRGA